MNLSSFEESAEAKLIHKELASQILEAQFKDFENKVFFALNIKFKWFMPTNTAELKLFIVRYLHNGNKGGRCIFIKVFDISASANMPLYEFLNRAINKFSQDFLFERKQYDQHLNEV